MTEEEKRRLALEIFSQEQHRLSRSSSVQEHAKSRLDAAMRHINRQQIILSSLAQQGITWNELKAAYDEGYSRGEKEMLAYRLSFFYAAAAIAFHEKYDSGPDRTAEFIRQLPEIMNVEDAIDKDSFVQRCLDETGVDTRGVDTLPTKAKSTRKDAAAVERMKRTGITPKDLEYERKTGYQNGRNREFYLSACYAAVALTLFHEHGASTSEIECFLDRIGEITDEEITTVDILERARNEAGVDVEGMAKG